MADKTSNVPLTQEEVEAIQLAARLNGGDMSKEDVVNAVEKGGKQVDPVDKFIVLNGQAPTQT